MRHIQSRSEHGTSLSRECCFRPFWCHKNSGKNQREVYLKGHPEGCEEHGTLLLLIFCSLTRAACRCDIIISTLYRLLLCDVSQRPSRKPLSSQPELHPVPIHSLCFHLGIDFIGPITPASSNGNRFILTLSDYYTKWVDAVPLPSKHATGVAASQLKVS